MKPTTVLGLTLVAMVWCALAALPCGALRLTGGSVEFRNVTLFSSPWEVALMSLEFDGDVHVQDMLTCPFSSQPCAAPAPCLPCDLSGPSPACPASPAQCCGLSAASAADLAEWCAPSLPYRTLSFAPLDGASSLPSYSDSFIYSSSSSSSDSITTMTPEIQLEAGEMARFRVFLPAEAQCTPFRVYVRPVYGSLSAYLSNSAPLPGPSVSTWRAAGLAFGYGYAQSTVDVCPSHPAFAAASTFSLAVVAQDVASAFVIELFLPNAPQPYLSSSSSSFNSSSLSSSSSSNSNSNSNSPSGRNLPDCWDFLAQQGGLPGAYFQENCTTLGPPCVHACLNDGDTALLDFPYGGFSSVAAVLLDAGCGSVGLSATPHPDDAALLSTDPDLYCVPLDPDSRPFFDNAVVARWRVGPDHATLSLCRPAPALLLCAVQAWIPGRVHFAASSAAPRLSRPVSLFSPYDFAVSAAIGSSALFFYPPPSSSSSSSSTSTISYRNNICIDLGACSAQWASTPSQDPAFFFPPPLLPSTSAGYLMPHGLPAAYAQLLSPPDPRRVVLTAVLSAPDGRSTVSRDQLLQAGTLQLVFLADSLGIPPILPNDGPGAPSSSSSSYFPTIAFSSLTLTSPICRAAHFREALRLADGVASQLQAASQLARVLELRYYVDLYLESAAFGACAAVVQAFVNRSTQEAVYPLAKCTIDPAADLDAFNRDPCCNVEVQAIQCCSPRASAISVEHYALQPLLALAPPCAQPACAASFLRDLVASLNVFQDPTSGCSTPDDALAHQQRAAVLAALRQCRHQSGIGRDFQGVPCAVDADCPFAPAQCDRRLRRCRLPGDPAATEDAFLRCAAASFSRSFDDWLRATVLPPAVRHLPSDDPAFLSALRAAASLPDCLSTIASPLSSTDPYNLSSSSSFMITPRAHMVWDALNSYGCKAWVLELADASPATVDPLCPAFPCLDGTCYVPPQQCMRYCQAAWHFVPALPRDACALSPATRCSAPGSPALCQAALQDPSLHACAYCPPDGGPCVAAEALDQAQCASGEYVACELPSGEIIAGISLDACMAQPSSCSEQCFDPSSATPSWSDCTTEAACLQAGYCSDRAWIEPGGNCFQSGYVQEWIPDRSTECDGNNMRTPNGCRRSNIPSAAECVPYRNAGAAVWQEWLTPAATAAQCLAADWARQGCVVVQENRTLWLNETECALCHGEFLPAFRWTAARWQAPVPRPLNWTRVDGALPATAWADAALSFFVLEQWTVDYAEFISSFAYRSQALCTYQVATNIIKPLVCDCADPDSPGSCYAAVPRDSVVAIRLLCLGESSTITVPSGRLAASDSAVRSSCVQVTISEISSDALALPPVLPSVSFSVARKNTAEGFVKNGHGAVVGNISSNGIVISVDRTRLLHQLSVCIIVQRPLSSPAAVPDFGRFDAHALRITPLYLDPEAQYINDVLHWCANLSFPVSLQQISLFAIERTPDAHDQAHHLYTSTDLALIYTLAAEYIVVFFFWIVFCLTTVTAWKHGSLSNPSLLLLMALNFLLVTIFRIVYLFAMPSQAITSDPVADFAVFELPTFFYLNALCFIIAAWLEVSLQSNQSLIKWLVVGITHLLSYGLFVATIIAVAVLTGQDSQVNSECPGRAPPTDSSVSTDIRNLSIAYQSIVISITFFFICLMIFSIFFVTRKSGHGSVYRRMILFCGITGVGLFVRCILFLIILAADFTSSIYMFITLNCTEIFIMFGLCFLFPSFRSSLKSTFTFSSMTKSSSSR